VPAPIQRGSEALALSKHYNLKGKLPLQLDEVIVPVHIVGELGDANGRECAGTVGDPAVAAQRSNVGLENPFDSGIVALDTKQRVSGIKKGLPKKKVWVAPYPDKPKRAGWPVLYERLNVSGVIPVSRRKIRLKYPLSEKPTFCAISVMVCAVSFSKRFD
jgi:hypothetical protein